jgi:hypothetical protein
MAKKEMYICDGPACGAVLLHPEDGFIVRGQVLTGVTGVDQKILIDKTEDNPETVLCRECLAERLGLPADKK